MVSYDSIVLTEDNIDEVEKHFDQHGFDLVENMRNPRLFSISHRCFGIVRTLTLGWYIIDKYYVMSPEEANMLRLLCNGDSVFFINNKQEISIEKLSSLSGGTYLYLDFDAKLGERRVEQICTIYKYFQVQGGYMFYDANNVIRFINEVAHNEQLKNQLPMLETFLE